jgi:hypothetical protein
MTPNSCIIICNQITSAVAFAKDLYSASVIERDTVACFLALHQIRLLSELSLLNLTPRLTVPRTDLSVLLTAVMGSVVGACKN